MKMMRWRLLGVLVAGAAAVVVAQAPGVLTKIQPGQWQLKEIGADGGRALCVADPVTVLQLGHAGARCTRSVIDSNATVLTVRYTCPGAGSGRTTLTFHSGTSFRLQTQGMSAGAPFDYDYDAKRVGDCPGAAPSPAPAPAPTPSGAH